MRIRGVSGYWTHIYLILFGPVDMHKDVQEREPINDHFPVAI